VAFLKSRPNATAFTNLVKSTAKIKKVVVVLMLDQKIKTTDFYQTTAKIKIYPKKSSAAAVETTPVAAEIKSTSQLADSESTTLTISPTEISIITINSI